MLVECTESLGVAALRLARLGLTGTLTHLDLEALASSLTVLDFSGTLRDPLSCLRHWLLQWTDGILVCQATS